MDQQQILALYDWAMGICFRHPAKGEVPTALVKVLHPRDRRAHEVRACEECVLLMKDARREAAARQKAECRPGHSAEGAG
jgi:hypothetical protein